MSETVHTEALPIPDPEPVAPDSLRLESGTIPELMAYIEVWMKWRSRQP